MDFDPLSLFTPECRHEPEAAVAAFIPQPGGAVDHQHPLDPPPPLDPPHDDAELPVHILDLPLLHLQPPAAVLVALLRLLAPDQVYNFSNAETHAEAPHDIARVFRDKNIDASTVTAAVAWLAKHCPRFDTVRKLAFLPLLSGALRGSPDYNGYLTRVVASELAWLDDDERDVVHKETALRLSENCGRTAQPEIVRNIAIAHLDRYLDHGARYVQLREPSLTSDNLGLKTWGSSLVLASRLVAGASDYLTGSVLELGSGTGLVGIVCGLLGYTTTLTDLADIVPNLRENVALNGVDTAMVHELDWTNPSSFVEAFGPVSFDTIVVSDPIYSSKHPYWVVDMIKRFLSKSTNARVLIQLPLRAQYEHERLVLWRLLDESFTEVESAIEDGLDDFGAMKFCFKRYQHSLYT